MSIIPVNLFGIRRNAVYVNGSDSLRVCLENFFLWFAAAIPEIASQPGVTVDRSKLVAIGQAGFGATCLGTVAMSQAGGYLTDDPRKVLLLAVLYCVFVVTVERLFMIGLTGISGFRNKLKRGTVRLLIAACASCIVTTCLELRIWEPEINAQLALNETTTRRVAESEAGSGDIPALEKRRDALETEVRDSAARADEANRTAIAEREGLEGTGKIGFGPIWSDKVARYKTLQNQAEVISGTNAAAIKVIEDQLTEFRNERERLVRNVQTAQDQGHGILARLQALDQIAFQPGRSFIVPASMLLVSMFFFLCELSPMIGKLQVETPAYDHALNRAYKEQRHHDELHDLALQLEKLAYLSLLKDAEESSEWQSMRADLSRDFTSVLQQKLWTTVDRFRGQR